MIEIELNPLIQTIRIFSQDIRMEFGIEKCIIIKKRKKETTERTDLLNQEN